MLHLLRYLFMGTFLALSMAAELELGMTMLRMFP
jgi:hypothetical protein